MFLTDEIYFLSYGRYFFFPFLFFWWNRTFTYHITVVNGLNKSTKRAFSFFLLPLSLSFSYHPSPFSNWDESSNAAVSTARTPCFTRPSVLYVLSGRRRSRSSLESDLFLLSRTAFAALWVRIDSNPRGQLSTQAAYSSKKEKKS